MDDIVCAATPEPFYAVALWYADFPQFLVIALGAWLLTSPLQFTLFDPTYARDE